MQKPANWVTDPKSKRPPTIDGGASKQKQTRSLGQDKGGAGQQGKGTDPKSQ